MTLLPAEGQPHGGLPHISYSQYSSYTRCPRSWEERFWSKVDASASCWVWTSATAGKGYGKYSVKVHNKWTYPYAHRYSWELLVGPIPEGMTLDHLCKNRLCVNPDHLEVVTRGENTLRGASLPAKNLLKTHCPRGHEYSEENTYTSASGRECRACRRERRSANA